MGGHGGPWAAVFHDVLVINFDLLKMIFYFPNGESHHLGNLWGIPFFLGGGRFLKQIQVNVSRFQWISSENYHQVLVRSIEVNDN